ncbi:putative calcium-binding protein CML36 [Bidens hawaiensis]|uniref:putative calcium-binding protein CML36 n=1 Tax=Bidens hawaiensis TaxID=980011 RepID=UPI00404936A2
MKIAGNIHIHPKHLFRSKKTRSVSRSNPSSFNSSGTTSSSSPDHKSKANGVATPTSVLPTHEVSSDEWSEASTDVHIELVQAFRFIDNDGDGRITREQLEAILNRIGGSEPLIREELSSMINEIDKNGDGIITLEEFGAISAAFAPPACDTELRDVFEFFDADHDGRITADELFEVLKSLGDGKCTLEECRSMIRSVDKNGDGFVCFEDFSRMMDPQM